MAEDGLPGTDQRAERQRVGGRAGGDEKGGGPALENLGDPRLGARGVIVGAVGGRVDATGLDDRLEYLRRHTRAIVACKVHSPRLVGRRRGSASCPAHDLLAIFRTGRVRQKNSLRRAAASCILRAFLASSAEIGQSC